VHLGQDDFPIGEARKMLGRERIIGISTHSRDQAVAAEKAGADYIGFGPIFATATKDAGTLQGTAGIGAIREAVSIPVIAIGGISRDTIETVIRAGASGVAVISAILSAPHLREAAREMATLFESNRNKYQGGLL
jgi:thiamine-phosphate diphosphorylase